MQNVDASLQWCHRCGTNLVSFAPLTYKEQGRGDEGRLETVSEKVWWEQAGFVSGFWDKVRDVKFVSVIVKADCLLEKFIPGWRHQAQLSLEAWTEITKVCWNQSIPAETNNAVSNTHCFLLCCYIFFYVFMYLLTSGIVSNFPITQWTFQCF